MNMRKYYDLLALRRSKRLLLSNRNPAHQTSLTESLRHPKPPPPPPSPPSFYSQIYKNTYRNIVSHHRLHPTRSNLTTNHRHFQLSNLHTSELATSLPDDHEDTSLLDYQVTVKGREVISADVTLGTHHWLPLSNLDLLLPPVAAGVFFCYKKKDNVNMSYETVVKTIKASLGGVLSTFYSLAGEIVENRQGEPEVVCNNRGVEFIEARADIKLKDLDFFHPDDSVKGKLVPKINGGVVAIQATELNCGSIIISGVFNHQLADAYSINMFLRAWAQYTRKESITNRPSFRPSVLNPRHPPFFTTSIDKLYIPISSLPPPSSFEEPLLGRMYYIHGESIAKLQSEASTKDTKRSKLLSFTAFLWKLLAHKDGDTTSRMGIVVNGRRFLAESGEKDSPLLGNHFGNVLSIPYGMARNNDLKEMTLHEVANGVHKFVAKATNEEHFRELIDWVELQRPNTMVARIYFGLKKSEGEAVVVSAGQGLPVKDMDFGWGKPEFGSYHFPWGSRTGYITTMPSGKKNGDWVVYMHLKEEDFNLIDSMAPNVFTPLTYYHI
ncbi:hypothetical protein LXL04_022711 [Taraxacum kok-saghyz]